MSEFPHFQYAQHVLQPAYHTAATHLFEPMLAANQAHVIMLYQQGIITEENAQILLAAITKVKREGIDALDYKKGVEDLFFRVEGRLIEIAGPEFGGNLQLARSRNDLGHALTRLAIRPKLLMLTQRLAALRQTILNLAKEHLHTIMPGYTHTQPAQPVTPAHYLGGVLTFLERDTDRLQQAYHTNNQSPLGAVAFTGTGFPIDRDVTAQLLGFTRIIVSSQDAIGTSDHQIDIATALIGLAVNLSRLTHDLLFRATRESGALQIDNSFIQISSIMPQKRNPVVLEHLRARLSRLLGMAQTIVTQCHNIPYGDTQDIEDEMEVTLYSAIATADDILQLYEAVFATISLHVDHLRQEAGAGFTTVTELADALVREVGLPFRTAHHIVSRLVKEAIEKGFDMADLTHAMLETAVSSIIKQPVNLPQDLLQRTLDPEAFVNARQTVGGVAPESTNALLINQAKRLDQDKQWLQNENNRLNQAAQKLQTQVKRIHQNA